MFCLPLFKWKLFGRKKRSADGASESTKQNKGHSGSNEQAAQSTSSSSSSISGPQALATKSPAEAVETSEKQGTTTSAAKTIGNSLLFAASIADNVPVPWVSFVTGIIKETTSRYGTMKLNSRQAKDLEENMRALMYVITSNANHIQDENIIKQFTNRIERIRDEAPADANAAKRYINADDIQETLTELKQNLDAAIQLLQVGLQIEAVTRMDEYRNWRTAIEGNLNNGPLVKDILKLTINAKGNIRLKNEGSGKVTVSMKDSTYKAGGSYVQHTQGSAVDSTVEGVGIDADGDVDISTFVTPATSTARVR